MTTVSRPTVGSPAPTFNAHAIVDGRLKEVSLRAYTAAKHWVVLLFYPAAWSYVCPTEILAFSRRADEFLYSRQCAVVFCSTDSEYCLRAWNNTSDLEGGLGGVHVPLMSDKAGKISREYGVLVEETGLCQRAMFVIDPQGIIRAASVNDINVGRSVDETQRVLDALSFGDEFGEGCPADWKKGDKGLNYAAQTRVEGPVELKKSWSEWARPRLQRAWSAQSNGSLNPVTSAGNNKRLSKDVLMNGAASPPVPYRALNDSRDGRSSPVPSAMLSPRAESGSREGSRSRMEIMMDDAIQKQAGENARIVGEGSLVGYAS